MTRPIRSEHDLEAWERTYPERVKRALQTYVDRPDRDYEISYPSIEAFRAGRDDLRQWRISAQNMVIFPG